MSQRKAWDRAAHPDFFEASGLIPPFTTPLALHVSAHGLRKLSAADYPPLAWDNELASFVSTDRRGETTLMVAGGMLAIVRNADQKVIFGMMYDAERCTTPIAKPRA